MGQIVAGGPNSYPGLSKGRLAKAHGGSTAVFEELMHLSLGENVDDAEADGGSASGASAIRCTLAPHSGFPNAVELLIIWAA